MGTPTKGLVAALALIVGVTGGYLAGAHHQDDTVTRQDKQLAVCDDVTEALYGESQLLLAGLEAGDDTTKLQENLSALERDRADLERQFGTHDIPTIMRRCTGG